MIDSLYIGATGMHAQQINVDMIANNLANVNTSAFKRGRVNFEDLLYRNILSTTPTEPTTDNMQAAGVGVAVANLSKVFTQGDSKKTDVPLDIAIQGQGFFEVVLPDGSIAYTRSGRFQVDRQGYLVTSEGHSLRNPIQIPPDTTDILIQPDGLVLASTAGEQNPIEIGQIELTSFVNPTGLDAQGNNLYIATNLAGDMTSNKPGEAGLGTLQQGFLESSNVKLVEEMINLIMAQRAYEVNAKVVQAADEMLALSNSLRR